ncbi:MAG: hypothetical protein GY940_06910 [bacterium]|nr:hypothetical protein [bacterium]
MKPNSISIKRTGTFFILYPALVLLMILSGCASGPRHGLEQPGATRPRVEPHVFWAGASESDITPPPGLPLWGHPLVTASAKGYWTRLKVRSIVFEDRDGKRVALVQLDWGCVSSLLHREVSRLLAPKGFEPGNLMIAATHTHAAPGGTFGAANYNKFGGRSGYYPQLLEWLAGHIAGSVTEAVKDLAPAGIAAGLIRVKGLSRNRSIPAWKLNFKGDPPDIYEGEVIPDVHVLRVDHLDEQYDGGSLPIAAFVVAPLHSTAVEHKNKLYHGDLHGVASRYLASFIPTPRRRFVAAVVAGPQGDVSPTWSLEEGQSAMEARRLGFLLAQKAHEMFKSLEVKANTEDIRLQYAYGEFDLPGAAVGENKSLSRVPEMGIPGLGGAEDGRSFIYGKLGIKEGVPRKKPKGPHTYKKTFPKFISRFAANPKFWPKTAHVQVIRLGDVLTLGTVPGEPTTETGRRINNALARHPNTRNSQTAVVALANNYIAYIATAEEYKAQHFEGGMTYWGPNESEFFVERISQLAANLNKRTRGTNYEKEREYLTGKPTHLYSRKGETGNPATWESLRKVVRLKVKRGKKPKTKKKGIIKLREDVESVYRFYWRGLKKKYLPATLPGIAIECNGALLKGPDGMEETDEGLNFIVKRKGKNLWSATWTPPKGISTDAKYRFKVSRPNMEPLYSEEFRLEKD